ncbi:IS1182 family transposase [uncultured Bacteroides sp.]|uniref:IS1182 family transposase n=1 Tax=uncultured Bacteroides sp. TaxID=162156 RepID=UPI0025A9FE5A|nr:IS1182 family transposase [uncultured Bacteroides sp.]
MSTKLHTKSYSNNDRLFFLLNPNEYIAENDPVRIVDAVVESLDLKEFRKLYRERGRCPYHPKMMLKIILYAYMNNIYSCRKIERVVQRDIHYIWLAAQERPDYVTINRFRNRVKNEINNIFTQVVLLLAERGFITLDVEYIDGTKIESKANKYTFVWRKTVEKNRAKLQEKIRVLLEQIDEVIAQDKAAEAESVEFTPETLTSIIGELKDTLSAEPESADKNQKKQLREKKKQIKELEKHRDKLSEYDVRLEQIGERNSMSKTDPDATFMRMKEDAMNNGQTKPGYNLQISAENQFITDFALFPNPTDTLTLIPFFNSFLDRYGHLPSVAVADSGYGSEENYRFMDEAGMEAYVKYNRFHLEQRPRYKPNPFHHENFHYNAAEDYYVCPMGQHMTRIGTSHTKTASGYRSESARYRAQNCKGCPLRCLCYKAKGDRRTIEVNHRLNEYKRKARELLTSEEGLRHRGRRCIEPEAVFGQMKFNMAYRRFRHFGKDKVSMDFAFFAIAFNLKKMCSKIEKQTKNGGNTPLFGLLMPISRILHLENRIFWKNPQKSVA